MASNHLNDRQLLDLALGQPMADEAGASRDHYSRCAQCRERLEGLRPLVRALGELSEADEAPALPPELWRQLSEQAEPLLDELSERRRPAARPRRPSGRIHARRSWAVVASVLLLVGTAGGVWLWSDSARSAAAAIVEITGPLTITSPGQSSRKCRDKRELLRTGDVLSTPDGDAAIRLDDASRLALRRGCRLEAQAPTAKRQATFLLREGSLHVDTTLAKRGVLIKTSGGAVRCLKGKTHVQVIPRKGCKATALEGKVVVESSGHVGVVSPGVCVELKRSKPCCYRPARPKETRCDWADRCGKQKDGRKK